MTAITYRLTSDEGKFDERTGTLADARKLALRVKGDVRVDNLPGSTQAQELGRWAGVVYYARSGGFKLVERIYGTYYTRGRLADLRDLLEDTIGRIEFQSPVLIYPKRSR